MSSSHTVPQTPEDGSTAPFVIHVDVPEAAAAANRQSHSAPQRIPADVQIATAADKKALDASADPANDGEAWEADICACCTGCSPALYAWCLPCMSAGDAFHRIGRSGVSVALIMGTLYIAMIVLAITFQQMSSNLSMEEDYYSGGYVYTYTYVFEREPKWGLFLSALACVLLYCLVVGKVRNTVRHFYGIPGSWARDLGAAVLCTCCTVAQVNVQTKLAEAKKAQQAAAATLPAYSEA